MHIFVRLITSSNKKQFSNFFHWQHQEKICNNNNIIQDHTAPQVCRCATFWNVNVLKQQLKTRLLQQHILRINNRKQRVYSQLLSKVCHIVQFLYQMFNVSASLLNNTHIKCVVTEVLLVSIVPLRHYPHSSIATHMRCCGIFSDSNYYKFCPDSDSEKSLKLKIDQYFTKL